MRRLATIPLALVLLAAAPALAEGPTGDRIDARLDRRGQHAERRLDARGDRIDRRRGGISD